MVLIDDDTERMFYIDQFHESIEREARTGNWSGEREIKITQMYYVRIN